MTSLLADLARHKESKILKHKLVINTPDLPKLGVLKFPPYILAVSDNFSSIIARCDMCTDGFSLIAANL